MGARAESVGANEQKATELNRTNRVRRETERCAPLCNKGTLVNKTPTTEILFTGTWCCMEGGGGLARGDHDRIRCRGHMQCNCSPSAQHKSHHGHTGIQQEVLGLKEHSIPIQLGVPVSGAEVGGIVCSGAPGLNQPGQTWSIGLEGHQAGWRLRS